MYCENSLKSATPASLYNWGIAPMPAPTEAPAPSNSVSGQSPANRRCLRSRASSSRVREAISVGPLIGGEVSRFELIVMTEAPQGT